MVGTYVTTRKTQDQHILSQSSRLGRQAIARSEYSLALPCAALAAS